MSDTHYMADQAMIPPLPQEPSGQMMPELPRGGQRQTFGTPHFFQKRKRIVKDGAVSFKYVEWVDITTPGDSRATPSQKVTDWHRQLFAREYEAFRRGEEVAREGWPIDMWANLNPQQVHFMKSMNIYTVEDIAGLADANAQKIPMGRTLKNEAIAALKIKNEQDGAEAMRKKDEMNQQAMKKLEDNNFELQAQLARMQEQMDALTSGGGDDDQKIDGRTREGRALKAAKTE